MVSTEAMKMTVTLKVICLTVMTVMTIIMTVMVTSVLQLVAADPLIFYHKVVASFPGDLGWCDLGTRAVTSKVTCGNLCSQNISCSLFCVNNNECQLYDARVTQYWGGVPGQAPLSSSVCYSSWGVAQDAAPSATFSATIPYNTSTLKDNPVNGYYCSDMSYIYIAKFEAAKHWWAADLGTTRNIVSVKIQTKRFTKSYFTDVEVRVGDKLSSTGDFDANQLLGFYSGTAPIGEVVLFKADSPISGRVVSIKNLVEDFLALPSVQIEYV